MVSVILGALLLWIPYLLVKKSPRRWWLWTSVLAIPQIAVFMLLAPIVIDPLFNKFGPMKDKALERQIIDLAARAGIEGARVFEVDKSEDTNTVNAYVTGFAGSKRIVLWDTTIKKLAPDELLFVMSHEMGHYVLGHVVKTILFAACLILLTLYAAHRLQSALIARFRDRFGFTELADIASLPLVLVLVGVLSFAVTPIAAGYSRRQEHEADRFGWRSRETTTPQLRRSSCSSRKTSEFPRRSLLYKLWRASHPLLGERIDFCNTYRPWEEGKPAATTTSSSSNSKTQGLSGRGRRISANQSSQTDSTTIVQIARARSARRARCSSRMATAAAASTPTSASRGDARCPRAQSCRGPRSHEASGTDRPRLRRLTSDSGR
jgi:Zn-dependent protease with chaperone function